jgi:hypothetical protein
VREPGDLDRESPRTVDGRCHSRVIFGQGCSARTLLIIALGSAVQFAELGIVLLAARVSRAADCSGRRRHGHRRLSAVDHSRAARCATSATSRSDSSPIASVAGRRSSCT